MSIRSVTTVLCAALLAATFTPYASADCSPDGVQSSGAIYRICMPPPEDYNGRLVVFGHGFQDAGTPVQIPEDQLVLDDGTSLPDVVNSLGFGFAMSSYRKTGLAILQGMEDTLDVVDIFIAEHGVPERIYMTGASEGGIITALLVEQNPVVFDGGVAACGPVGDFPYQINYFGNGRVLFEYFFPGLIPGDPFNPPQELVDNWSEFYEEVVLPAIFAPENQGKIIELIRTARLPYDPADFFASVEQSIRDVLRYSVVNLNDAADTIGGFPFDNRYVWYSGSSNDVLLNLFVRRADADPAAVMEMVDHYNTTGQLERPLITIHTLLDQQIPYEHEVFYQLKTLLTGSYLTRHVNLLAGRYGHCNFTLEEIIFSLALLLWYADDLEAIPDIETILDEPAQRRFRARADAHGLPYTPGGGAVGSVMPGN